MTTIQQQVKNIFAPQTLVAPIVLTKAAQAIDAQRVARITKTALYALAAIGVVTTILLTEAAIVAWPVTLTVIAVTLVAGGIFYYLNKLDRRYQEGLDDKTRTELAQRELEKLFCSASSDINMHQIDQQLSGVNKLLGHRVFSSALTNKLLGNDTSGDLQIKCQQNWHEKGLYGLPAYDYEVDLAWSGKAGDAISVAYKETKVEVENKAKAEV